MGGKMEALVPGIFTPPAEAHQDQAGVVGEKERCPGVYIWLQAQGEELLTMEQRASLQIQEVMFTFNGEFKF